MEAAKHDNLKDKLIFNSFMVLLVLIPMLQLSHMFSMVLVKDAVYFFVVCLLILAWLLLSKKEEIFIDWRMRLILLFMGLAVVSTLGSVQLSTSVIGVFRNWEGLAAYFILALTYFLAIQINWTDRKLKALMNILVLTATLGSVLGLQKFLNIQERISLTFLSPNTFSFYLMIAWPLALGLLFWPKITRFEKFAYSLSVLLITAANIVTFSRTGWVIGVLLFFMVMLTQVNRKQFLRIFLILAMLMFVVVALVVKISDQTDPAINITKRFSSILITKNLAPRTSLWQSAIKLTLDRPLTGYGPNTFSLVYPRHESIQLAQFRGRPRTPHNYPLNMAATLGIPALVVLSLIFFLGIKEGYISGNYLHVSLSISLIGMGMLSFFLEWPVALQFPFWLFIGAISQRKTRLGKYRIAVKILLSILMSVLLIWVAMITASGYYFWQGKLTKDTRIKSSYLRRATILNPYVYDYWNEYILSSIKLTVDEKLKILRKAKKYHPFREELVVKEIDLRRNNAQKMTDEIRRVQELQELLVVVDKVIEFRPLSARPHFAKAKILSKLNKRDEAITQIDLFLSLKRYDLKHKNRALKLRRSL